MSPTQVTNFSLPFLHLVMNLTMLTFTGNFSQIDGELYYYRSETDVEMPAFYIYKMYEGNRLFIGVKGTTTAMDAATDVGLKEIYTKKGVFYQSFYRAAMFVYQYSYGFIKTHDGPVYFIGHSMGAAVSTILHCLAKYDFPTDKDINTVALAPVPTISDALNTTYGDKIVTIINGDDAVPTISIPNLYSFLCKYEPLIPVTSLPWNLIKKTVDFVLSVIYHLSTLFTQATYEYFMKAISASIDSLVQFGNNEKDFQIRYVPGTVFQISAEKQMYLNESIINVREKINILSLSIHACTGHDPSQYQKAIDNLL